MKVFVHYYDECHGVQLYESPFAEIELDCAPLQGEQIWLPEEAEQKLHEGAVAMYRKKRESMYDCAIGGEARELIEKMSNGWNYITPEIFEASLCFDYYWYVVKRLFVAYNHPEELPNGLHVFLYCEDNIPEYPPNTLPMQTYAQDYTKIQEAEELLHSATRLMANDCHDAALERINEARTLLQEYTNGTNLVEDDDVEDGLVKRSDAEAAIEEAKAEDILKSTIEGLYHRLDAGEPFVTLERPHGLDCDLTVTLNRK